MRIVMAYTIYFLFGYCGDVLFPLMVLSQIVDSIDSGLLYSPGWNYRKKTAKVRQRLMDSFKRYPNNVETIMSDSVEIMHGIRDDADSSFHCMQLKWTRKDDKWHFKELPIQKYCYFAGMQVDNYFKNNLNQVEWRNDLFERCDGKKMNIIKGAQKQPHI